MKHLFSKIILATTIIGMTAVPVFAAAGHAPHRVILKGSAAGFHGDVFDGARVYRTQELGGELGGESEGDYGGSMDDDGESEQRFRAMGNSNNARKIIKIIDEGEGFCRILDAANKIDCLAEVYTSLARGLSSEGDEGVVKRALEEAAGRLEGIVRANLDPQANLTRPTVKNRQVNRTASRPLRAIKKASIPAANRQAEAVVTELSTVLLRSSANSTKRKNYYAKIAQAVDSNKVLLRS